MSTTSPAITAPEQMHSEFGKLANLGNVESLLSLYEPGATIAPPPGSPSAHGEPAAEHIAKLIAMRPRFTRVTTTKVFQAGDIALLCSDWEGVLTDPDGNEILMQGKGTEVLRRQPDGHWLCVIDNPWGTENAYGTH